MTGDLSVRETIETAMAHKDVVAILYHGGSNPGGYREILPLKITKTGKLQAKCLVSNSVKFFVFENIELTARVAAPAT